MSDHFGTFKRLKSRCDENFSRFFWETLEILEYSPEKICNGACRSVKSQATNLTKTAPPLLVFWFIKNFLKFSRAIVFWSTIGKCFWILVLDQYSLGKNLAYLTLLFHFYPPPPGNVFRRDRNETLVWNGLTFYDRGPYHIETSQLIYRENHWTGFYVVGTSVLKDLIRVNSEIDVIKMWEVFRAS